MKTFRNYTPSERTDDGAKESLTADQLTAKIASVYNGKSNADILRGILIEAEKSKRNGTLSNEEIDDFYRAFAPMLDSAQCKKLRAIVEKLKTIS